MLTESEATNATYFIGVYLPAGTPTNSVYTLTVETNWLRTLGWDPGTTDLGTQVYTNTSASGGDYYFKVTTQNTANGAWRTALCVLSGEADLYLRRGSPALTYAYDYASMRVGSDGIVLAQSAHWSPGQEWYLTVCATPGAQWTLLTGEAHVQQLPPLTDDAGSGTNAVIGPEGVRFFKTTIPSGTLAWRLGLNGMTNTILVDDTRAPILYGSAGGGYYDWRGDASGVANPYNLLMNGHKTVTAVFGITNDCGADYRFQLTLASSAGSPPDLQDIGVGNTFVSETVDGCSRVVRLLPLHNGLQLVPTTGVMPTNVYTIVMLFRLDQTNGYRRLVDFKAGTSDYGLYVYNGRLFFKPTVQAPAPTIAAGNYVQVVVTRDGTNVVGYVNGIRQFSFTDTSLYGVISSANALRFFKDDGATEESGGAVARIRLYPAAMPDAQVALLDRADCFALPYFQRVYLLTNVLHLPVTNVVPGISYRLLASTNLTDWSAIQTSTPPVDPTLFTDPHATNYRYRFYRLVTP